MPDEVREGPMRRSLELDLGVRFDFASGKMPFQRETQQEQMNAGLKVQERFGRGGQN